MNDDQVVRITPDGRGSWLAEIWRYRELLYFLAWRDLLLRYRQTAVGITWSVLRPLLVAGIMVAVFSRIASLPSDGVPYVSMVLAALVPWQLFSTALTDSGASLVGNPSLVNKVAIPRMVVPLAAVAVAVVDAAVVVALLGVSMAWNGCAVDIKFIAAPVFILVSLIAAIGAGLWVAALSVRYRDVRHVLPFIVQLGLYTSPIGYSSAVVPERWRLIYALNPLSGAIDGLRWSLFPSAPQPSWPCAVISAGSALAFLIAGLAYFRSAESTLADDI